MANIAEVNYKLLSVKNNPTANCNNLECAICYKSINKSFLVCSEPCNKVFHLACVEEAFRQIEENANENEEDPVHRCCYCRRLVNINNYDLEVFAKTLRVLRDSNCYDIGDALALIRHHIKHNIDDEDADYVIYLPKNRTSEERKPKHSKQSKFKRTQLPRARKTQKIGMRR
jgi:hypothetical protein